MLKTLQSLLMGRGITPSLPFPAASARGALDSLQALEAPLRLLLASVPLPQCLLFSNFNFAKAGAPPVPSRTAVRPGPSLGKIKICKTNERTNDERTNERAEKGAYYFMGPTTSKRY